MPADPARRDVAARDAGPDGVGPGAAAVGRTPGSSAGADAAPGPEAAPAERDGLSERDRRILALEGRTFRYVGAKERAIREEIGLSKVAYYVRLNALLDEPAALRAAPALIHRLRGRRTSGGGPTGADGVHRVA